MDSITHALYRAIVSADAQQRDVEREKHRINSAPTPGAISFAGLKPLSTRKSVHEAYAGAAATDLHISLEMSPDLLAVQMEMINAGFRPPASMYIHGADVIISPERIDVYVPSDDGNDSWAVVLSGPEKKPNSIEWRDRKAFWKEC